MMLYLEGMKLDEKRCFVKKNPDEVLICFTVLELFPSYLLDLYFKVFSQQPKGFKILLLKEVKKRKIKKSCKLSVLHNLQTSGAGAFKKSPTYHLQLTPELGAGRARLLAAQPWDQHLGGWVLK